jgi:zinc protease
MIRALAAALLSVWAVAAQAAVEIQEVTSPGGIEAWLVEEHSIPFTALEIHIRGGANLDREGKRGAVNLMMALLEEGSGDMDAAAFQEAREGLAASFGFDAGDDTVSISASMLTRTATRRWPLRQALVEPRFDEDAIERVRAQVLSASPRTRRTRAPSPRTPSWPRPSRTIPYGSSLSGTPRRWRGSRARTSSRRIATRWCKDRVYVGAVGDITPRSWGAARRAAGRPAREGPRPARAARRGRHGRRTRWSTTPTPQAVAIFGQQGIERDDPDYFAASSSTTSWAAAASSRA